jgi:hypothetical protein
MANKGDPNKGELTLSGNRSLAIKRSDLVKRGLDLIEQVDKRQTELVTDREKKALERVITDCESHFLTRCPYMFSSMTDFYKFLYTEVKGHAKVMERVDFEKAKEAYISWAKKSHPAEFDRLFMGFFNEILDGKKTFSRQKLWARIEGVDFQAAAEIIAYAFREAAKKGEAEGVQYITKKEFKDATDHYIERPCFERAITLLEKYPSWLGLFELTKDPSYIWVRDYKKSKE